MPRLTPPVILPRIVDRLAELGKYIPLILKALLSYCIKSISLHFSRYGRTNISRLYPVDNRRNFYRYLRTTCRFLKNLDDISFG
jgi:hypothetical protein